MRGKWIWINKLCKKNEYAEFITGFKGAQSIKTLLKIACDGVYSVYVNGKLAAFSACADYPWYKFYDEIDS